MMGSVYVTLGVLALFAFHAESVKNFPMPPVMPDPPFGYCNSGSACHTCLGDMVHMRNAFTFKITQATTSVNTIISSLKVAITRLNTSVTNINVVTNTNTNIIKHTVTVSKTAIITQLDSLRILINTRGKGPDTSQLTHFLTIIYKVQGDLHMSMVNLQKYINQILINIKKGPTAVINKINRIRVYISTVSQKLIAITQVFVKFKKIEQIVVIIEQLRATIENINVVVVNIEQHYKTIVAINQQIEIRIKTINNNQLIQFQRIESVLNIIEQKNLEVIRNIESYSSHFTNVEVLIKNVDINIIHVVAQIKRVMIAIFENKHVLTLQTDVNLIFSVISKFMSSHSKTVRYIADMKIKNQETYATFKSIRIVVQKFALNVDKYIESEKIMVKNVLSSLDAIITFQNTNMIKINQILSTLKGSLITISQESYRNSQSFSATSVKITAIKNKMAVAISTLKNLLTVCKCGGQASKCGFICSKAISLVCANDQRTYTNECEMRRAGCKRGETLRKISDGPCSGKPKPCVKPCPKIYAPVCGSNNQEYANICLLQNHNCMLPAGSKITVAHRGKCVTVTTPAPEPSCRKYCISFHKPVCASNGRTFGNQCELDNYNCGVPAHAKVTVAYQGKCRAACKSGFYPIKGISGCFYVKKPERTEGQEEARKDCERRGASLISFSTDTEFAVMQAYISKLMTYTRRMNFWTAGRQVGTAKWVWFPDLNPMQLTNKSWYKGRPQHRVARCATMYGTVKYAIVDVNCEKSRLNDKYGWVCRM